MTKRAEGLVAQGEMADHERPEMVAAKALLVQ